VAHESAGPPDPEHARVLEYSLRPSVEAPRRARHAVAEFVGNEAGERFLFALQLVVSELVKNAVLYGAPEAPVRLEVAVHPEWIELRVVNGGERIRMRELRTRREEGGRGLEIVDRLTWGWSIESSPVETAVSIRVPILASPFDQSYPPRLARPEPGYEGLVPRRNRRGPDRKMRQSANGRTLS
jgi:anti-sigma regulatory factor (Ser/Thr protein kinase)